MQAMTYNKAKVLERLKANREEHAQIAKEAADGYREAVKDRLRKEIERLDNPDEEIEVMFLHELPTPTDYTESYDEAIDMLEFSDEKEVSLSSVEFNQYMRNKWSFSLDFKARNSHYSASAASL